MSKKGKARVLGLSHSLSRSSNLHLLLETLEHKCSQCSVTENLTVVDFDEMHTYDITVVRSNGELEIKQYPIARLHSHDYCDYAEHETIVGQPVEYYCEGSCLCYIFLYKKYLCKEHLAERNWSDYQFAKSLGYFSDDVLRKMYSIDNDDKRLI